MSVIFSNQQKRENRYLEQFILSGFVLQPKGAVQIECVSEDIAEGNVPDYYIPTTKTLIEVSEVHDRKSREKSTQWGRIVTNLRKQIKRSPKLEKIAGLYAIDTSPVFKFPRNSKHVENAANQILDAVIDGKSTVTVFGVTFEISKISDEDNGVYFATSEGGAIDAAGTIHQNIYSKLGTANKQLAFVPEGKKVAKRILLFVNQYTFADRISEVIDGLSYAYENLLTYENIDEVWFQNPTKDGKYTHDLLYTREFLHGYSNQELEPTEQNAELLGKWFSPLSKIDDNHRQRLFHALRVFLSDRKWKPNEWFEDSLAREEMVRFGIWLSDKKRLADLDWLIGKFVDDPNPEDPEEYSGDPRFNYHQQILDGEDPSIVTTVLGNLAWVIHKLAAQKEKEKKYTLKAFEYTKRLINERSNLYVKMEAIIPLVEIAKRRQWFNGYGKRPRKDEYKDFHNAVFSLVKIVEDNPKCVAIAKWLSHVFAYYKDLSTEEAERVLNALEVSRESAGLFIYFGIYRKNHYEDQPIEFDGEKLEGKLRKVVENRGQNFVDLRGGIVWHLWKLLDENPNEFATVSPYIGLFLQQPYNRKIYGDVERVIEDWIEKEFETCLNWFENLLNKTSVYARGNKGEARNIWLTPEKVIEAVAKRQPEKLLEFMEILVELWKLGAFVGSPKRLFESYKLVGDWREQEDFKSKFKNWYKTMKELNPKLETVSWS